jgi:hypothetical protein
MIVISHMSSLKKPALVTDGGTLASGRSPCSCCTTLRGVRESEGHLIAIIKIHAIVSNGSTDRGNR